MPERRSGMNEDDEERYRARAEECCILAENARSQRDKEAWLKLASDWLSLVGQIEAGNFDSLARERGTGQPRSTSSH
jgi:hypothetical protein